MKKVEEMLTWSIDRPAVKARASLLAYPYPFMSTITTNFSCPDGSLIITSQTYYIQIYKSPIKF